MNYLFDAPLSLSRWKLTFSFLLLLRHSARNMFLLGRNNGLFWSAESFALPITHSVHSSKLLSKLTIIVIIVNINLGVSISNPRVWFIRVSDSILTAAWLKTSHKEGLRSHCMNPWHQFCSMCAFMAKMSVEILAWCRCIVSSLLWIN